MSPFPLDPRYTDAAIEYYPLAGGLRLTIYLPVSVDWLGY